jgi:hypothetical protein
MTGESPIIVQGIGTDCIIIERAPRAGEYGWKITAVGVDADHALLKAQRMVAGATALVKTARVDEAVRTAPPP